MSDEHDDDQADERERPYCTARTRGGQGPRCKRRAMPGHDRCPSHAFKVPGRPSKLEPKVRDRIIAEVLEGAYLETAAQAAGVNKTTLYRWLRRADDAEAQALEHVDEALLEARGAGILYEHVDPADWPYLDFRHALKSAQAYAELETMRTLRQVALGGGKWQAFGFLLERRHPDKWRRRESTDVSLTGEVKRSVEVIVPTDEERAEVLAKLRQADPDLFGPGTETTNEEDPDGTT